MTRKIWAIMLALIMVLSMAGAAFAAEDNVAFIGETGYPTLAEAINAAESGANVTIQTAGTYEMPDTAENKTFSIQGGVDGVVIEIKDDGSYEHCDYSADGANITLNNVTITARNDGNNYRGYARCKLTCNNCVINGELTLYAESIFTDCVFNVSGDLYNVWTWGTKEVTFDGCEFNSDGKSLLVYNQTVTVNIKNCEFNDNGGLTDLKAAIETGADDETRKYVINVTNTKVNGYEINDKGLSTGTTLFGNKNALEGDNLTVTVDGVQVWPKLVAKNETTGNSYTTLQDAVNAAEDGAEIIVIADHELIWDGETKFDGYPGLVVVAGKAVTIDLNGKVIAVDTDKMSASQIWAVVAADKNGKITMKDSSSEGTGAIKAEGGHAAYCLMMAYENGTSLTVENGTYYLQNAIDSLLFAGGSNDNTDGMVTVMGGSFKLGNIGTGENGKPWTFNVLGAGDHHASVTGGTFNADINRQHWSNEVLVPETHYTVENNDGTWTVKEGAVAYVNEGMVTGPFFAPKNIGYATFEEAVSAAVAKNDKPVTLLADIVVTAPINASETTLNQNGKAIILTGNGSLTVAENSTVAPQAANGYVLVITANDDDTTTYSVTKKSSGGGGGSPSYQILVEDVDNGDVTASRTSAKKNTTVTLTVTPDEGYELDELTVTDKNGKEIKLTDKGNGKYTFTMPSGKVNIDATFVAEETEEPADTKIAFVDVDEDAYYAEAVKWAVENNVTTGTSDTTFGPDADTTRAQTVTFLWRAMGEPEPTGTECQFVDVAEGAYYYDAVLWAVENGITEGTSATEFSPNETVTRAQTVTFLWRMAGKPEVAVDSAFADVDADAYYYQAVKWAVAEGITSGLTVTTFGPDADCTRGQIVTFLWRCMAE